MRYVLGVLFFAAFVVFVTPSQLAVVLTMSDGSGDPAGLLRFGVICALIFGTPGAFAFPRERRLQAIAWLALACLVYGGILVGAVTLFKTDPGLLGDPGARTFFEHATLHYGRFAVISVIELALWATLFRRRLKATPDSLIDSVSRHPPNA